MKGGQKWTEKGTWELSLCAPNVGVTVGSGRKVSELANLFRGGRVLLYMDWDWNP